MKRQFPKIGNHAIHTVRNLVREAGYNVAVIQNDTNFAVSHGAIYSRARTVYECACESLRMLDAQAQEFIDSTYGPNNRTKVTSAA